MINNKLTMVCCNANQVYLHFNHQISISIDSNQFQIKDENKITEIKIPIDNLKVFKLLENKVVDVSVNMERSILEVEFENRWKILLSDDKHYESHTITINKNHYIV